MGKITGFMEYQRLAEAAEPVPARVRHYREFIVTLKDDEASKQGARCMDCGIPFCQTGCPVNNIIPDWNDLVYRGQWKQAWHTLDSTNNFPEFTGRICPAPCESSCTLNINNDPVGIKSIEHFIIDKAWEEGWVLPQPPKTKTGKRVAVVGSGPAGMACAQQLARAGHSVVLLEKSDRIGGLLRYGIPEFKMEKRVLDRRLAILEAEGVIFRTGVNVGVAVPAARLRSDFDAVVLAGGAEWPRDLKVPGRELQGIHFAMEYLTLQNRRNEGDVIADEQFITARDKHVVIIGGGDTGADCLGTAHRQGARGVTQLELLPKPPDERAADNPWPQWPNIFRVSPAHEEGCDRLFSISTQQFVGDAAGHVRALRAVTVEMVRKEGRTEFMPVPGSEQDIPADLVLLAMGFLGPERSPLLKDLGVTLTDRGNVARDGRWMTNVPGVFAAGDMQRGQSLIVWAIAEGRSAARAVDQFLMGESALPAPLQ